MKILTADGWGLGDWFWEPLREQLIEFSLQPISRELTGEAWVGLGHSLGFRKLLQADLSQCLAVISLGGFLDFCGPGGNSPRIIQRMVRQFRKQPEQVLTDFYQNCGFRSVPGSTQSREDLTSDLESLLAETKGGVEEISHYGGVRVFAISGRQDRIVPSGLAARQFANVTFHSDSGHSLGYHHPAWCAEEIRRIVSLV